MNSILKYSLSVMSCDQSFSLNQRLYRCVFDIWYIFVFTDFSNKVSIGKHAVCMSSKYHVLTNFIWIFNLSWQVFTQIDRVSFQENYSNNVVDTVDKSPDSQYTGIPVKRSGFHTWSRQYVLFLGKTRYSHSASLHPECKGYRRIFREAWWNVEG